MTKRRADAIVNYPSQRMVVASVSTTGSMIVLSMGDGREEHYTYPPDGRFHVTCEDGSSERSFFAPGPSYEHLNYHPLALVDVPLDSSALARPDKNKSSSSMVIEPPLARPGLLEIGILGQQSTPQVLQQLSSDDAQVDSFPGPRSDTTIMFRYVP